MDVAVLVSPAAGRGKARAVSGAVLHALGAGGLCASVLPAATRAEAERQAAEAVAAGTGAVVAVGGDGCAHAALQAVAGTTTPLAVIPAGTGNDLCRGLGLDPNDAAAGAAVIAAGHARLVDLTRVGDRFIGGVMATGFDALVNRRANEMFWPRGSSRYTLATLAELRVFSPLRYRLTLDGEVRQLAAMLVAIGNTASYGGGMRICPRADPFDGELDVTIIHPVGRLKLLRLLPEMFSGKFARDACVEQLRAVEVTVEGPGLVGFGDGEMIAAAPLTACVVPRALQVYVAANG